MVLYDATVLTPDKNPFEELFKTQLPYVFTYTKFTWWKAIIAKWFNIILTFVWSYTDLFVILLSIGLSTLYEQINCDLEHCRGKVSGIISQSNSIFISSSILAQRRQILDITTYSI